MGKLVRDRIPEIIEADGREPVVRTLNEDEYDAALLDKLVEEVAELREAGPAERIEEAADLVEVLRALITHSGHSWETVLKAAERKRTDRGGFERRVWLDSW